MRKPKVSITTDTQVIKELVGYVFINYPIPMKEDLHSRPQNWSAYSCLGLQLKRTKINKQRPGLAHIFEENKGRVNGPLQTKPNKVFNICTKTIFTI